MRRPFVFQFVFDIAVWATGLGSFSLLGCGGKVSFHRADVADASSGGAATCGDETNCGACGAACSGTCRFGRCVVTLASEQVNVDCIAIDATSIYWINAGAELDEGSGELRKAPRDGGEFTTLATAPGIDIGWPCRMKIGGSNVYWTTGNAGGPVFRIPTTGGAPFLIASSKFEATALALDATSLYWTGPYTGVWKSSLDGSEVNMLATQGGTDIAVDVARVYWTLTDDPSPDGGQVMSAPLNGGGVAALASGLDLPEPIAADVSGAYWGNYGGGTVMRVVPDGTVTILASEQFNARVIALDESNVYWGTAVGSVMKVPKAGGPATQVASGANVLDLAVDGASVYWTDGSNVMKVTPK